MRDLGTVTVVSVQFLVALAVLSTLGWWLVWRRRGRPVRKWPSASAAGLLTLALIASAINAHFSYLPTVADVVGAASGSSAPEARAALRPPVRIAAGSGRTVRLPIPDDHSGLGKTTAMVWLPPQYFSEPQARFRVVYLFHGSPGVPMDWFRGGEANTIATELARAGQPAIVVAPRMSRGWLDDSECVDGLHEKIETHLRDGVIPEVDRTLRTIADRDGRIFAGMSAGGYCALNLGLRNRSLVSTVVDLSGFTEPTHSGGTAALFGPGSSAAEQNTPARYAHSLPMEPAMRIWLDSGTEDTEVLSEMRAIHPVLVDRGFQVELHTRPGGHTYSVWRPGLHDGLAWALSPPGAASVARVGSNR